VLPPGGRRSGAARTAFGAAAATLSYQRTRYLRPRYQRIRYQGTKVPRYKGLAAALLRSHQNTFL
jgi:hypothetical protein